MAQFPCLPIWTDAWVADTDHLTCEEEGVYFRLVRVMWRTPGCRVPNDVDWLAKHMRMTTKEVVEKVWPIIQQFCNTDGNWVFQKRLKREFVRRFELSAAQSARAKRPRKKNKISSPELAAIHDPAKPGPAKPPEPEHLSKKEPSFFPLPRAIPSVDNPKGKETTNPARSLATAPDVGALTREPDKEPAERKKPEEMTLAEINAIRYGRL